MHSCIEKHSIPKLSSCPPANGKNTMPFPQTTSIISINLNHLIVILVLILARHEESKDTAPSAFDGRGELYVICIMMIQSKSHCLTSSFMSMLNRLSDRIYPWGTPWKWDRERMKEQLAKTILLDLSWRKEWKHSGTILSTSTTAHGQVNKPMIKGIKDADRFKRMLD